MNPGKIKEGHVNKDHYIRQDVFVPASNWFVAASLIAALILNFLPLQGEFLLLRPDFLAITIAYWNINYPHKMGMSVAFGLGLMMDVGNAGILVTRVIYRKRGEDRTFLIVDAAMNDLIRPTLYDAHHEILPVRRDADAAMERADVVGPVCETGDYLALDRELPASEPGDLLAIMSAGAYGAVQAGTYNSRLLIPEVLVKGADAAVVRARPSYDDLIGLDTIPAWLA